MLLIPFIITIASQVAIKVMVMMRFAELYIMTTFASLPIAFLGHPDTKSMGISYLQKYAAVSLQGATLMLAVFIYSALNNHAFNDFRVIGKIRILQTGCLRIIQILLPPGIANHFNFRFWEDS